MKSLRIVLVLGFSTILLFGVLYPAAMVGIGKIAPSKSNGLPVMQNGKLVGFENVGQPFSSPHYFWSRPSAVDYDASSTGGSNLGPTNPDFLAMVQSRIDTLLKYHPELEEEGIPVEMVTASGSGLDPHITQRGALMQANRVAKARDLDNEQLIQLIKAHTEAPLWGLFGPPDRVNVLKLNLALDAISEQ